MNRSINLLLMGLILSAAFIVQAEMGVPLQLRLKSPSGTYPSESGVTIRVMILSPTNNCILREENFTSQNIVNGNVSVTVGSGALGSNDPGLSLNEVYNNSTAKTGLSCVDANSNVISTGQSYTPASDARRIVRISTVIGSDTVLVNFNMRAAPYAIQAESVGGKAASDILVSNSGSQLNQTNLNNLLLDATRLTNLVNFASTGSVTTATNATNFSGALAGDVNGNQGSTTVARIRGVNVSATAPANGDVLQYNGTQYVPVAIPSAPVTSVAGRTGAVTLSSTDISGLGTAASQNVGTSAGNVVQLDGTGKIPVSTLPASGSMNLSGDVSGTTTATVVNSVGGKTSVQVAATVDDVIAATSANTAGAVVRRDGSGNVSVNNISSSSNSTNNLYLFDGSNSVRIRAPSGLSGNYILTLPDDDGAGGQFLQTDGSGNLVWANGGGGGSVNSVTASGPLSSSGGANPNISLSQASASAAGYLSSADWSAFNAKQSALGFTPLNPSNNLSDVASISGARTNLGLGGAALLNVGTAAGTVAAGDDSRITGALQSSAYNTDVGSANCTTTQTPYWNTVSDQWLCQAISFPVTSVTASGPLASSGGSTPNISIPQATATAAGYLSSADWSAFNSKQAALGFTPLNPVNNLSDVASVSGARTNLGLGGAAVLNVGTVAGTVAAGNDTRIVNAVQSVTASGPLASSGGTTPNISLTQASVSAAGYLSSADWSAFNSKQAALGFTPLNPVNNLSDVSSISGARTNLGLGGAALLNVGTASGTVAAGNDSRIVNALQTSTNLSGDVSGVYNSVSVNRLRGININTTAPVSGDILQYNGAEYVHVAPPSAPVFSVAGRTGAITLSNSDISGLGGAAVLNVGTAAGTVAAGDDSRITGALQASAYNTDVGSANCTTSQTPYWNTVSDQWLCQSISFPVTSVAGRTGAVNLVSSDISGLGTAAILNAGVSAGNVVQLDGTDRIPASTLPTNALTISTAFSGDVTGMNSTISVDRIKGISVSGVAPTAGQALVFNGTQWVPTTGFPTLVSKSVSQTLTSNVAGNVSQLAFSVEAGNTYKYKFNILFTSVATTTGLALGLTYPSTTVASAMVNIPRTGDGTGAFFQGVISSSGDITISTATPSNTDIHLATLEGVILPSANGTVQLIGASEVNLSNVTIWAGSYVEFTKLP